MCHSTPVARALQQAIPKNCTAKTLGPNDRLTLGLHAIAGVQTITQLANDADVSRKFVHRQANIARTALDEAFAPTQPDDEVLFYLPVTKTWLRQVVLGLTLLCHSSFRGVIEFFRDLLAVEISLGTVHNIHQDAIAKAQALNSTCSLANIEIAALDEIFQNGKPVLVGADVRSTYCFLLSAEAHRDADTWGVRLLELQDRGFAPDATIADFATGLRAGQEAAFDDLPCRGDVFHVLQDVTPLVTFLENRAYEAIATHDNLQHQKAKVQLRAKIDVQKLEALTAEANVAGFKEIHAIDLADEVGVLARWLHQDVLAVSGLPYVDRVMLYDFVVAELRKRKHLCPHRIGPVCKLLENQRDPLLAFARQLEADATALAEHFQTSLQTLRDLLDLRNLDVRKAHYWCQESQLRERLGERFWPLSQAVEELADSVVRASSVVENINSRLRNYFFLRRQLGKGYLSLLQFFLNHRRFMRSERAERQGKSPAELLTNQTHPHWLAMLGYRPFAR
jgi:hypothetical protein